MKEIGWIAFDWGTSRLRAWAMSSSGELLDEVESDQGVSRLSRLEFEPALMELIDPWLGSNQDIAVIGCGMVGSKQGLHEVPYLPTPCEPSSIPMCIPVASDNPRILICPGIKQMDPPDVMRGEETQIAGFLVGEPGFEGVVCLPGSHSKWVEVSEGKIRAFQTFMTGELFELLATRSMLCQSVKGEGWDDAAFTMAVAEVASDSASFAARLFSLRARDLLQETPGGFPKACLSGYLIGLELVAAQRWWKNAPVAIIGERELSAQYRKALVSLGALEPRSHDSNAITRKGLFSAFRIWREQRG